MDTLAIYLREITRIPLLTDSNLRRLVRLAKKGDEQARDTVIVSNLKLVVRIARGFYKQGLPMCELIAEGNLGLIKAVEKFDPERKNSFSTYAAWWIKQTIRKALGDHVRPVRIPAYMQDTISKWREVALILERKLNRQPSIKEIASELDIEPQNLETTMQAISVVEGLGKLVSLNVSEMDVPGRTSDETTVDPEKVEALLSRLSPRTRAIIKLRFGIDCDRVHTLKEIADKVGLTRERVRQIERETLKLLRRWIQEGSGITQLAG